jgi:methyl halide transferase
LFFVIYYLALNYNYMNEESPINPATISEKELNETYWNARWRNSETGWDIGYAAPAITKYASQLTNKNISILIPGCGNAYEAAYLAENGFTNITLIDIAPEAAAKLEKTFSGSKQVQVICGDFFVHEGAYDLIIEQTFFCALLPEKRSGYVQKMASLLNKNGKLAGLLFNCAFEKEGPPFGGSAEAYKVLFEPHFNIQLMETCYNSIPPRTGNELFVLCLKKNKHLNHIEI